MSYVDDETLANWSRGLVVLANEVDLEKMVRNTLLPTESDSKVISDVAMLVGYARSAHQFYHDIAVKVEQVKK